MDKIIEMANRTKGIRPDGLVFLVLVECVWEGDKNYMTFLISSL